MSVNSCNFYHLLPVECVPIPWICADDAQSAILYRILLFRTKMAGAGSSARCRVRSGRKVPVDARMVGSKDLWAAGAVAGMALREGREGRLLRSTGRTINRPFLDHGCEEMLHCWQ